MRKRSSYADNISECVDGVMEQFRLLRRCKGEIQRAATITRQLSSLVSVGNLEVKFQRSGLTQHDLIGWNGPEKVAKVASKKAGVGV